MKILHTSDWHLGQILYSYDRTDEYLHFFDQLKAIASDQKPDALLVSGDIFDVSSPSTAIMKLFTDFILQLHESLPQMSIVVISGNHDSASRIDVNRNLWKCAGIHVIGNVARDNGEYDFSQNLIEIKDKGVILAIPYINRAYMASQDSEKSQEQIFFDKAANFIKKFNTANLPCVLMAHLTVEGCDMKGHRLSEIGNINAVKPDIFSEPFDYVALGHIHRSQNLDSTGRVRYAGTPIAVEFDEDYPHYVSIIEIEKEKLPVIEEVEITPLRKLKTFPESAVDFKTAVKMLSKLPDSDNSYIRLNVSQEKDLPSDCQEIVTSVANDKQCRFCMIKYTRLIEVENSKDNYNINLPEFSEITPIEIADRFFSSIGLPKEQADSYIQLLSEIQKEYNDNKSL